MTTTPAAAIILRIKKARRRNDERTNDFNRAKRKRCLKRGWRSSFGDDKLF
jgi:hypothetical protein